MTRIRRTAESLIRVIRVIRVSFCVDRRRLASREDFQSKNQTTDHTDDTDKKDSEALDPCDPCNPWFLFALIAGGSVALC
jgi:hypothetical protein